MEFNKLTKSILLPLVVTASYASFIGGTSTKAKDKGDEAHAGSIERSLYHSYIGDDEKKIPSHVGMFCDMTGTFARFVEKGYATVTTTEMTNAASTNASVVVTQTICFDLENIFRYKMSINLEDIVCRGLKLSTLSPTSKTVAPRTLYNSMQNNVAGVKKLLAFQKEFYLSDANLPSGTSEADLFEYIWSKSWKKHSATVLHNSRQRQLKKAAAEKSTEKESSSDSEDDTGVGIPDPGKIKATKGKDFDELLPLDDVEAPLLTLKDCKWFPVGWPVYVMYVCEHTRIHDEYVHLFVGDAQSLDKSAAKSRREERSAVTKANNDRRKGEEAYGQDRGKGFEQRYAEIQLAQNESKETFSRLESQVTHAHLRVESICNQKIQAWQEMIILHDNNGSAMKKSDEWPVFDNLRKALAVANRDLEKAQDDMNTFHGNDEFGDASKDMMRRIGVGIKRQKINSKSSLSISSPPVHSIKKTSSSTPMSELTPGNKEMRFQSDPPDHSLICLGIIQEDANLGGVMVSTKCQVCQSGIQTNHYCTFKLKCGEGWKVRGNEDIVCGLAFCISCVENFGYDEEDDLSRRTICPAHYSDNHK